MVLRESETVEFKEIVAVANTEGGTLHIGIADDGRIAGVADADADMQQLSNIIRDSIKPDVTIYLSQPS